MVVAGLPWERSPGAAGIRLTVSVILAIAILLIVRILYAGRARGALLHGRAAHAGTHVGKALPP